VVVETPAKDATSLMVLGLRRSIRRPIGLATLT
jgi:hypothetical protein